MTTTTGVPQPAPANSAPAPHKPRFIISGDSPRELMLRAAQEVLKAGLFISVDKLDKDNRPTGEKYELWNLDDSGKVNRGYNDGITLTEAEAKTLPTGDGCPAVFSCSLVLRQMAPVASIGAKIAERRAATAQRDANAAAKASDSALLAELNKRRVAQGLQPIE